jgi:hypothetical protein
MSLKLIIVADLQHFKLFSLKKDPLGRESLETLQNVDSLLTHQRLSEKVSDQKGNFQGVGVSGSYEDHNLVLEGERRRIEEIADQISNFLQEYHYKEWCFAAPKAINNQIIELLAPAVKKTMKINLHADLTNIPSNELLSHFNK